MYDEYFEFNDKLKEATEHLFGVLVSGFVLVSISLAASIALLCYALRCGRRKINLKSLDAKEIERRLEDISIHDAQILLDIVLHLRSSGSSERNNGPYAYFIDKVTDAAVFRPKVMPPLRDAMCLVDGIERDFHALEELKIVFLGQRLGSHIEQLGLPCENVFFNLIDSLLVERRVQEMSYTIIFAEVSHGVDLVFHQGNEWRDDNSCTVHQQRGQLVAQRLATTGGHQHKGVVLIDEAHHDLLLLTLKGVKTKILLQRCDQLIFISHLS